MTTQPVPTVQRGVEITIPLNKLKKSPRNARRTPHATADVEALAASIGVKGVLQPPVVEPEVDGDGRETGAYLVTIGEGRRLALMLLAKRKLIAKAEPIRCLLDQDNDAFEVSLDENVTRAAMHPADQFEAFRDLAEHTGWSAEEIGARFGVTAQTVRQRLRLGAVSPRLMAAYRAGDVTMEQLMAFAVSEDHERQEQVYANLSYNRSASLIRRLMTEDEVEAEDRRAVFVGHDAYQAAGGHIRRDLFGDDRGGWFEDVTLLDRLALEKLAALAEAVKSDEGWRWAEAHLDYPRDHGWRRLYPRPVEPDEATAGRLSAIGEEYDAIITECGELEPLPAAADARLREIDVELEAFSRPAYEPDAYARAGVFVVLDWNGGVRIERGFVRPQDDEPTPATDRHPAIASDIQGPEGEATLSAPEVAKPLSDRMIADLSAHRTAALRDALASQPDAALLAALHALVVQTFYPGRGETSLELRAMSTALSGFADGYFDSIAGRSIEARHEAWGGRLPETAEAVWESLRDFPPDDRTGLFAHCVSLTLNAVTIAGRPRRALIDADRLADHLGLDMTQYWQATVDSYFGRISKAQILEAVREAKSPEMAATIDGLKKEAMAQAAADLLGQEGWLPPLLRNAAATPA